MDSVFPVGNKLQEQIATGKGPLPRPELVAEKAPVSRRPIRVLIADDQLLVRAGICELVKLLPHVKVVGLAADGREALRLIDKQEPDMILMDTSMPEMNGLEATVLAKKQFPHVKIIILSDHSSEELVFRALRSGAEGFLLKHDSVEELYSAISSVAQGDRHLSPKVTKRVVLGYLEGKSKRALPIKLSPRQREILQLIAHGKATKEIASLLKISVNTVKTHRLKLMEKLGAHEITGLVRYAARLGFLKSPLAYLFFLFPLLTQIA